MTYQPRLAQYAHQKEAVDLLDGRKAFALFLDMGTGKTKIIIDEFTKECSKGVGALTDLLIIAPAGSYSNWAGELERHLDPALFSTVKIAVWRSAKVSSRREVEALIADDSGRPRVLIMNVEALSTVTDAKLAVVNFLKAGRATAVVDESTALKNHRAKRTRFMLKYAHQLSKRRRILSGLPSPNSPLDLWAQFEFLDPKIFGGSYYVFRSQYCHTESKYFMGRNKPPVVVVTGYKNVEGLSAKIKPFSYRKTKDECLDLPPKIYMPSRIVEMTDEQKKVYSELKEKTTVELEKDVHVDARIVITKLLRLHQVLCGHVTDEQGTLREIKTKRLDALLEVLADHSGKAIIWANYNHSIAAICKAIAEEKDEEGNLVYGERAVARFYGGNSSTRNEDERRWKEDPACRFLVASQGAGSMGNTWVEADLVVYYSNDFSLEHRLQSEDRAHRSGQRKSVTYVDLMTPNTIDEKIIKALRNKIDLASTITGDNYKEWLI